MVGILSLTNDSDPVAEAPVALLPSPTPVPLAVVRDECIALDVIPVVCFVSVLLVVGANRSSFGC